MKRDVPEFCDFDCPYADFPPGDTAGICRTMSAVWCQRLRELVNKNRPCEWRRRQTAKAEPPATRADRTAAASAQRKTRRKPSLDR